MLFPINGVLFLCIAVRQHVRILCEKIIEETFKRHGRELKHDGGEWTYRHDHRKGIF